MNALAIDVHDPRADPEPVGWAAFRRSQNAYANWEYGLLGLEGRWSGNPNILVTAREGGRLVAAFTALLCRYRARRPMPARGLSTVVPRWWEVHHRWLSGAPGWMFAEDLDHDARRDVVRAFERAVRRYAGPGCLGVVYRCVRPHELDLVTGRGRLVRDVMGYAELPGAFGSAAEWVSSLPRSRRHSVRGQIRKVAADPDLDVAFAPARTDLDGAELAALLNAHRESFGRIPFDARGPHHPGYLDALVRHPDVHTLTYRTRAGRLVGLATLVDHPVCPTYQHWATVRPEDGGKQHLYFASYARLVDHMADRGAKSLNAGRGMLDLKARLGFTPRPLHGVVVPRSFCG